MPFRKVQETRETRAISNHSVIAIVSEQLLAQLRVLPFQRTMPVLFAPLMDPFQAKSQLLRSSLLLNRKSPVTSLPPIVSEAEKVEGLRLSSATPGVAEVHNARLFGMDGQAVLLEALRKNLKHTLGILPALHQQHEVVGGDALAVHPGSAVLVETTEGFM